MKNNPIVGYKIRGPEKDPIKRVEELVKRWNDMEFCPDTNEYRLELKTIKDEINCISKIHEELISEIVDCKIKMKNYGI
ncbi:MAG: hypothetical protein WC886_07555 [Saccharofermentanaceae bacterium]|jgi:hypothetical protein